MLFSRRKRANWDHVIQGPEGDEVGNIIKPMTGEEITKVMEVRNVLISNMAVDDIVMVNTGHG